MVVQGAALLLRELMHLQAEALATGAQGDLAAVLRLGTSAFLAVGLLPPVIARLTQQRPPVAVRLREDNVPRLFEALLAGELDALVTLYNPDVMAKTTGREIRFEPLAEEPYEVIAPPGHRLSRPRARPPGWQALAEAPWVLTRRPSLARVLLEDRFRRHGVTLPEPLCETDGPVTASAGGARRGPELRARIDRARAAGGASRGAGPARHAAARGHAGPGLSHGPGGPPAAGGAARGAQRTATAATAGPVVAALIGRIGRRTVRPQKRCSRPAVTSLRS